MCLCLCLFNDFVGVCVCLHAFLCIVFYLKSVKCSQLTIFVVVLIAIVRLTDVRQGKKKNIIKIACHLRIKILFSLFLSQNRWWIEHAPRQYKIMAMSSQNDTVEIETRIES